MRVRVQVSKPRRIDNRRDGLTHFVAHSWLLFCCGHVGGTTARGCCGVLDVIGAADTMEVLPQSTPHHGHLTTPTSRKYGRSTAGWLAQRRALAGTTAGRAHWPPLLFSREPSPPPAQASQSQPRGTAGMRFPANRDHRPLSSAADG